MTDEQWLQRIADAYRTLPQGEHTVGDLLDRVEGVTPETRPIVAGMASMFLLILTWPETLDIIIDTAQPRLKVVRRTT